MSRGRSIIILASFVLTLMREADAVAQDDAASVPPTGLRAVHYYNGASRVDVLLAENEIRNLPPRGRRRAQTAAVLYDGPDASGRAYEHGALLRPFTLKPSSGVVIETLCARHGLAVLRRPSYAPGIYIVEPRAPGLLAGLETANLLYESGEAELATPLLVRTRVPRVVPNDTFFPLQWHLNNTGQPAGSVPGNDINISDAWDAATGAGVNIAITDTGVPVAHEDIAPNARTDIDIDFIDDDDDPTPTNSHGASVAGMAAAKGNNGIGVTGAAYNAGIVGIRFDVATPTDADEADAMSHQVIDVVPNNRVHINNNSWGPADNGQNLSTFGPLTEAALVNGTTNGRGGLGVIYVWAGGNGFAADDNVNYDGYASSRYTIAVGATGADGVRSSYSEQGASLLVNAPSSYAAVGTTTTTTAGYTSSFTGTSASAPLVAGVAALMLEVSPTLGWRDVQHILVDTASKNDPVEPGWADNGSGRPFNHNYGFGRVDASAAVDRAGPWVPVPSGAVPLVVSEAQTVAIPDNDVGGIDRTLSVTSVPAGFFTEHVELVFSARHPRRGELRVTLTSPQGKLSVLARPRGDMGANYSSWKFTSTAHWGENPEGLWTLTVSDRSAMNEGSLSAWQIAVHGYIADTDVIWADSGYAGYEHGTRNRPYSSLQSALDQVDSGGTIRLLPGVLVETTVINQPVRLEAASGGVRIGG